MLDVEIVDIDTHLIGADHAREQLHRLELSLADMHGPIEHIIDDLHHQTDAQFASMGVAAGTPWDPLNPSTVRNKMRMGYPAPGWPLVASGGLRESAIGHGEYGFGEVTETQGTFGLDMERNGYNIAALQQFGVDERKVHRRAYTTKDGHHVQATSYMWHLPARPMLVATEALADQGLEHIAVHIWSPLS